MLSTTANAGSAKDFQLTVTNSGTAPLTNVAMSASAPTSWKVEFDPATIPSVDAGATQNVTAHITPDQRRDRRRLRDDDDRQGDRGDRRRRRSASASRRPQFWWIVGVVLIVAVFAGLYWVFRTYGRR